ncbi:MAG TPA: DUF3040 domain-containing protein [Acidimicrobiales bacterium]|nr:DUF3040 domain-containing protein [Acidimicrobiales bacterium]
MRVPLSEEEQRILQEMEQKLREHDREFVERVSHGSHRLQGSAGLKWSATGFLVGTIALLGTFRSSLVLAVGAVLLMLVSSLAFAQLLGVRRTPVQAGTATSRPEEARRRSKGRSAGLADEWRRMRSRFGHRG